MSWIVIQSSDVTAQLLDAEAAALLKYKPTYAASLSSIVTNALNDARSSVGANKRNELAVAGIPPEMVQACLAICVFELLKILPAAANLISGDRRDARKEALDYYDKVATGKRTITQPVAAELQGVQPVTGSYIEKIHGRRPISGEEMGGL